MAEKNLSWFLIVLIYINGLAGMLVVSAALPALPGIGAEFHPQSPALIGLVMSMPALAAATCSLLIGALVDRIGDRTVLVLGCLLVLAGDIGVIASPSIELLLACRVLAGLGYVCMVVAAVTMITRLTFGRTRTAALGLWSTVIPASFIVASIYGAVAGQTLGWRWIFGAHAAFVAILAVLALALLPGREVQLTGPSRLKGLGAVLRTPFPYLLGISFAAAAFLQTGFVATLPHMLGASIGLGKNLAYSFNAAAMLCNVIGAFSFGLVYNRGISARALGFVAVALCALPGALLVMAPGTPALAMLLNCLMMAGLGLLVGMWALMPQVAPSPTCIGATSGLITQITLLGVLFGPPVAFAAGSFGAHGTLIYLLIGVVISLIALPVWQRSAHPIARSAPLVAH
ncbi:MFS transporter [Novosphingobium sp. 9]|uniref:MFS transporter n=1 Tax=Novosphingobium sp. 9 TaxID=2025349 RepID=UPI0021B52F23|nr:MFS transporter [Novosphingobium sp. 9]